MEALQGLEEETVEFLPGLPDEEGSAHPDEHVLGALPGGVKP